MAFEKTGMNLTNLNNISNLNLNVSFTPSRIIDSMIGNLNSDGGIWTIGIIFVGIYIMLLWTLSEDSPFAKFKYSYLRGSLLGLCVVNLISITMISVGIVESFRIVAIFLILNILNMILVLSLDNNQ